MNAQEIIGLNTKWYRYQNNISQEQFAVKTGLKLSYVSRIECGRINLTSNTIDLIVKTFKIKYENLFNEKTALKAKKLPPKINLYTR